MVKRCLALLLAVLLLFSGCTTADVPETTDGRKLVGISLPDNGWDAESTLLSQPLIAAGYRVSVEFANGDPQIQQLQLEKLLSHSVDLLIVCAIDSLSLTEQLQRAKEENIPVLAYDRMLMHTDAVSACVALDTHTAGQQLGQYILETVEKRESPATIELFMGSPDNNNDYLFHQGLLSVLHPLFESKQLTALSGRTSFEDTCVQNADPDTARSYLLDYLLDHYEDAPPDILCVGGSGMAGRCMEAFEDEFPLIVGIGEKDAKEPLGAYAYFDRELLADTCVRWAQLLLEDPAALPQGTTQNNGLVDVPTFLQAPTIIK